MRANLLLVFLLLTLPLQALAGSPLAGWLQAQAAPKLARVLDEQPRFIGESIGIHAMSQGRPEVISNALTDKLRREIRQQLLARSNARIPLSRDGCLAADTHIVLGIEVTRESSQRYRVVLALLDLEDNLWINGSSQVWQGRLSSADRDLLATPRGVPPGSTLSGYGRHRGSGAPAIPGCDPARQSAESAVLSDQADGVPVADSREQPAVQRPVTTWSSFAAPAAEPLLTALEIRKRRHYCRGEGRSCIDVGYELLEDAYVIEFYTRAGSIVPFRCDMAEKSRSGRKGLGLKVPQSSAARRPSLGYYLLATRNPALAQTLSARLGMEGDACGASSAAPDLEELADLVTKEDVTWRSLHLGNRNGSVFLFEGADP